ncbi:MAG: hypothetical protein KDK36_12115, partial [Leptospiraceae bacterium]|nr:hypothetical protein [Leptospiraceae bacterium]
KENKDKALEELNRYMESSKNQWYSHVSGMQNVLVSSADSIETIVSNKEWFQKKVNWFNARIADPKETGDKTQYASLRDTYQGELNYWINMEGKYRQMITNSQDFIHNTDVRNTTGDGPGLLDNNGSETDSYVYTVEEFNLKIAKKELLLLEQKKKEAETVYNYAIQNAGTKTSEEIAAELDQKRAEYETKQKTYLDLLTELNGGVGDASSGLGALANNSGFSENNTTTQTATQTTTSLQADLEAANKILEEKRKALELKRTDLDTARIAYEEALKLQVLVNNPDLLLNVNSISITGDTDEYTDFRKEINAAISQISEANEKVRQQEAAYYPILLERQNALRTQDYYNYINQKILDFEDTKGRLADLRALLDNNGKTTAEKMELLINPTDRDLLVEIYGNEVSANLKSQLTELKTSLEQGDTPIVEAVESFLNDYTLLNSYGEGVVNSFSQAEKLKVQNYLNTIKNTGNQLSSLQGVDTTILQNESLLQYEDYLSRLLNGWDDQLASFEETKTTYDTAYNEFTAYINANPDKKGSAEYREKVLKFGLVAQNYLNVTSTIQQYSKAISNSGNAINTIILDLLQKSTVLVDSTLVGKDRENRLSEINNLKEAHKNSITGLSEALTAQGTAYTEVNQNAAKFYSSYQNVNNAVEKRTVLYENSYNFLNGIVETLRSNYESQKNQLTFLLNENGNLNTLNSMQDNLDITWKKEAARVNQRAAEILKNLVSNLNPSQRNLSVIIGDFENNLQKDYANYYSNPTFQLEVSAKKSVLGYLKKNYLQLNNSFMSSYDDFVSNTNNIYEQSNEILNFYANGGFFPPSDLERIKTSGTDAEKRLLYEFYSPGRMMMFAGTAMNEIAGFQNTFNEFKQFAEGAKSGEILTVLKEDYFREQENKSTGLYNELMTAIPSLGNLSSDQLYGDTASANAPREFDSVETEDRRRLLADLLGTVTLENVEEKVALLNNPANSQSILPDDIREDLLNDINTLLYGLQTDRIAPTETAEVLDRFIDTYRILEKNYLNNENNNQIIPRTRDLLVQAGTFTKIMELGNSRFPAINTRRTTRDANGVDPGGNGYIETFEYSDVNGKYIDDPDYRDINGLSINQDGFKQIDGFRYPPIQNVDDYTFLDAQGKVMSYYDAIIDTKNKYEVSAENVKTALDDLLAKQANDPNYTLSEEYINDVRNFKDIMVNHSSLASFLGYNYSLLNEFTRNFDEKLNAAIKQIKTSIDLDPDKNFIVSNSGNNQPDGDTLPQILEAYNQNPQSFIVIDSSDPSYSATERWLINLDYYTKGTTLKLIDTTYTGMLSTASQYNYIEAVNREVLKILDQYDRKDEKLSQLKDVIDNLPSRIEIYKPAVAVNQISPDQMINAYKDIRNYFAEKEFKGEEIENGLRDILNEVAPLTDELENLQYY